MHWRQKTEEDPSIRVRLEGCQKVLCLDVTPVGGPRQADHVLETPNWRHVARGYVWPSAVLGGCIASSSQNLRGSQGSLQGSRGERKHCRLSKRSAKERLPALFRKYARFFRAA